MSETVKHTEGEWEARSRTEESGDYPVTEYYVWAYPYGREGGPQSVCHGMLREGDAVLIAAASDLLSVCQELVAELAEVYCVSVAEYTANTNAGHRAAEAIAKAETGIAPETDGG